MYSENVKGHFLVYLYFWIFVFETMAVSFVVLSVNTPLLTSTPGHFLFSFLISFFFLLLIKCINILLIFGHYTWIHTYSHLYNHIDIIFSQLRKNVPFFFFFLQLAIALGQSHTHDNSPYTRD